MAAVPGLSWAATAQADPALCIRQTQVHDGGCAHMRLTPCGNAPCGTIPRTFKASGEDASTNMAKQIVRATVPQGGDVGAVWRSSNDTVYLGKMDPAHDRLTVRGCVAGGLFCLN